MRRDGGQDERCVAAVRAGLAGRGDPERAQAQQRYMKSSMPYLGLAMPELRSILRPVLAAEVPVLGSKQVSLSAQVSSVQDVDLAEMILKIQQQSVTYQGALAAAGKSLQPSLMDYLK